MEENNLHHGVGHEESDINAWVIGKFAIALTLITIVSLALLYGMFRYYLSAEGGEAGALTKFPPAPQLQTTPASDLKVVRAAEEQMLHSYGWVDKPKGIVHLPIDRAIDLLSQKGLPSRPAAQIPTSNVSAPTESGLGIQTPAEGAK